MNQHQIHDDDQKASPPTDYNSNMMSITKSNDDILTELRPKTGPIISNLMPVPEPRENTPAVPALPPKTKPGMQTLSLGFKFCKKNLIIFKNMQIKPKVFRISHLRNNE
jgi:hypothetical protein